jgi:5-methylcytosine-specific restriction endonuclease McrA
MKKTAKLKIKRPKTPKASTLRKRLETLVKDFVKKRDKNICQRCGKYVEGSDCHGSHVIPVSAGNQFRFDPINIKVLCYHCHLNWFHKNPLEAAKWFREKFPDRYEYLFGKPRQITKISVPEYLSLIEKYKKLLKEL